MSEISDMIQRLCPDGVEYRKLVSVAKVQYGYPFDSKLFTDNPSFIPLIRIRDVKSGLAGTYYSGPILSDYIVCAGDILVGMDGEFNLGKWKDRDSLLNQRVCKITSLDSNIVLDGFLYHLLLPLFKKVEESISGSTVKHLSAKVINALEIPVPPLEVQRKIVEVLDNFSELTAKLTAELEARKKQYEYYRDNLLNFSQIAPPNSVKWMKLGEIGDVKMCKRVMKHQTNTEYGIPFYKIGTFGKTADAFISQELFNELKNSYSYPKYGDILISASGTIGRTVVYNGEDAYYQDSNIVWIDNDESIALNSYLKIIYQVIEWKVEGGTIKRLYNDNIKNTVIPIPPLSEQERIVSILDRFEALTTDLTSGLPAEIKARQQQYEYYRDQLLTFKRAN